MTDCGVPSLYAQHGCLPFVSHFLMGPHWLFQDLGRVHVEFSVGVVRVMDPEEFCEFGLNADSPPGFVDIQGHCECKLSIAMF